MGKKRKPLSQAEIWDDSALLKSWDDALAEYKLYHSIHARGERVEDVIKEAETEERDAHMTGDGFGQTAAGMQTNNISSEGMEDGELVEEPESTQAYLNGNAIEDSHEPSTVEAEQMDPQANASTAADQQESGMPNAVVNGVKDQALKDLMMSWYYAGYYTGLYEGQQHVQNTTSK